MIIIVMGVSGSGKTTIGSKLAEALGCSFLDGDALHSAASIEQMGRGVPLTDDQRAPWLAAIRARMLDAIGRGESLVVACSALRASYREFLGDGLPVTWVHLDGPEHLVRQRLAGRSSHFAKVGLLASQLETLEPPHDAIVADISMTPDAIVQQILGRLPQPSHRRTPGYRVVSYDPGRPDHRTAFRDLNLAWIEKHFVVEPRDRHELEDPETHVLQPGGKIFLAESSGPNGPEVIGACALLVEPGPTFELAKMAVADGARGRGVGRALALATIEAARELGARQLELLSNTSLAPAIALYRSLGFVEVPLPPTDYARANIKMVLVFPGPSRAPFGNVTS